MKTINTVCLTAIAVALFLLSVAEQVQAGEITLQVGITGNNTLEGLQNPVTVAKKPEVSKLLQADFSRLF